MTTTEGKDMTATDAPSRDAILDKLHALHGICPREELDSNVAGYYPNLADMYRGYCDDALDAGVECVPPLSDVWEYYEIAGTFVAVWK